MLLESHVVPYWGQHSVGCQASVHPPILSYSLNLNLFLMAVYLVKNTTTAGRQ
jgi:hypothetical protein